MVDSHGTFTVGEAKRFAHLVRYCDLAWFEEPIPHHDHAGEAEISAALDMPVASGESVYTSRSILEMLRARACDVIMADLQHMGGPTEFLKAATYTEAFDTPFSNHCFTEMSMPLLAAIPTFGQTLAMGQVVRGEAVALGFIGITTIATLIATALLLYLAFRLYEREEILFPQ